MQYLGTTAENKELITREAGIEIADDRIETSIAEGAIKTELDKKAETFLVTIYWNDDDELVSDKTTTEIYAAYQANKIITAKYSNDIYSLIECKSNYAWFNTTVNYSAIEIKGLYIKNNAVTIYTNTIPEQTDKSGQFLSTTGSDFTWANVISTPDNFTVGKNEIVGETIYIHNNTKPVTKTITTTIAAASRKSGDVDGNGSINATDAYCVNTYLAGSDTLTAIEKASADIDENAEINSTDSQRILETAALKYTPPHKYSTYATLTGIPKAATITSITGITYGNTYMLEDELLVIKSDAALTAGASITVTVNIGDEVAVKSDLTTSISSSSTDTQYPSAKAVYEFGKNKEDLTNKVPSSTGISASSTDTQYPSAKAVYDFVNALEVQLKVI